jgi:hypothetical protein
VLFKYRSIEELFLVLLWNKDLNMVVDYQRMLVVSKETRLKIFSLC